MSTSNWYSETLKGENPEIPRVCPNCMAPAEKSSLCEYTYGNMTYFCNFFYCPGCSDSLKDDMKCRQKIRFLSHNFILGLAVLFVWLPLMFAFEPKDGDGMIIIFLVSAGIALILMGAAKSFLRFTAKRQHPMREGQAVWGGAVDYRVSWNCEHVFIAARPEWLKALVEGNPFYVDNATYERVVGVPKPEKYKRFD